MAPGQVASPQRQDLSLLVWHGKFNMLTAVTNVEGVTNFQLLSYISFSDIEEPLAHCHLLVV